MLKLHNFQWHTFKSIEIIHIWLVLVHFLLVLVHCGVQLKVSAFLQIYHPTTKYVKVCQNALKCIKMQQNVSKCNEMYQNALKCIKMQRNVLKRKWLEWKSAVVVFDSLIIFRAQTGLLHWLLHCVYKRDPIWWHWQLETIRWCWWVDRSNNGIANASSKICLRDFNDADEEDSNIWWWWWWWWQTWWWWLGRLTEIGVAYVFGNLIARLRLREMAELLIQHSLELRKNII